MNDNWHKVFHTGECVPKAELVRYVNNELPPQEQNAVERHLLDCELCADTVEGLELLRQRDPGFQSRMAYLQNRIETKQASGSGNNQRWMFWSAAASIVILLGVGITFWWPKPNAHYRPQIAENPPVKLDLEEEILPGKADSSYGYISANSNNEYAKGLEFDFDAGNSNANAKPDPDGSITYSGLDANGRNFNYSISPTQTGDHLRYKGNATELTENAEPSVTDAGLGNSYAWTPPQEDLAKTNIEPAPVGTYQVEVSDINGNAISPDTGTDDFNQWMAGTPSNSGYSLDEKAMPNPASNAMNYSYSPSSPITLGTESNGLTSPAYTPSTPIAVFDSTAVQYTFGENLERSDVALVNTKDKQEDEPQAEELAMAEPPISEDEEAEAVNELDLKEVEVAATKRESRLESEVNVKAAPVPAKAYELERTTGGKKRKALLDSDPSIAQAEKLGKAGKHQASIDLCDQILAAGEGAVSDRARLQKAKSLIALNRPKEAKALLQQLAKGKSAFKAEARSLLKQL